LTVAYESFCQQRKEELANMCSFSGERVARCICTNFHIEGCAADFKVLRRN
jgi:hypothetical protein